MQTTFAEGTGSLWTVDITVKARVLGRLMCQRDVSEKRKQRIANATTTLWSVLLKRILMKG
jgi:hypothetical protein